MNGIENIPIRVPFDGFLASQGHLWTLLPSGALQVNRDGLFLVTVSVVAQGTDSQRKTSGIQIFSQNPGGALEPSPCLGFAYHRNVNIAKGSPTTACHVRIERGGEISAFVHREEGSGFLEVIAGGSFLVDEL